MSSITSVGFVGGSIEVVVVDAFAVGATPVVVVGGVDDVGAAAQPRSSEPTTTNDGAKGWRRLTARELIAGSGERAHRKLAPRALGVLTPTVNHVERRA
jgi:hypothetical protein